MRMRVSAAILLSCIALSAHAAEVSLDLGADILHKSGMPVYGTTIKQNGFAGSVMFFDGNSSIGLERLFDRGRWTLGLGAVYVEKTDGDVGTHWNFLLSASYRIHRSKAHPLFRHISHGRALGIEKSKPNGGLNFLMLQTTIFEDKLNERKPK